MKLNLAERLRTLRTAHGMTQEQLAEHLGVSAKSISRWECGATYPDLETVPVLAGLFGVSIENLLDVPRTENRTAPPEIYKEFDNTYEQVPYYQLPDLRRAHITYPLDDYITYRLAMSTDSLAERRTLTDWLYDEYKKGEPIDWSYVESAVKSMIHLVKENEILPFLTKVTNPIDLSRELCLEFRYRDEPYKNPEKYRKWRAHNARWMLENFLDRMAVGNPTPEERIRDSRAKLTLLDLLASMTPEEGEIDMWSGHRLDALQNLALGLAQCGEYEESLRTVEEFTRLEEAIWNHPTPAKLSYRLPSMNVLRGFLLRDISRRVVRDVVFRDSSWKVENVEKVSYIRNLYHYDDMNFESIVGWKICKDGGNYNSHVWTDDCNFDPIRKNERFRNCIECLKRHDVELTEEEQRDEQDRIQKEWQELEDILRRE